MIECVRVQSDIICTCADADGIRRNLFIAKTRRDVPEYHAGSDWPARGSHAAWVNLVIYCLFYMWLKNVRHLVNETNIACITEAVKEQEDKADKISSIGSFKLPVEQQQQLMKMVEPPQFELTDSAAEIYFWRNGAIFEGTGGSEAAASEGESISWGGAGAGTAGASISTAVQMNVPDKILNELRYGVGLGAVHWILKLRCAIVATVTAVKFRKCWISKTAVSYIIAWREFVQAVLENSHGTSRTATSSHGCPPWPHPLRLPAHVRASLHWYKYCDTRVNVTPELITSLTCVLLHYSEGNRDVLMDIYRLLRSTAERMYEITGFCSALEDTLYTLDPVRYFPAQVILW